LRWQTCDAWCEQMIWWLQRLIEWSVVICRKIDGKHGIQFEHLLTVRSETKTQKSVRA